ncbi:MAG: hypothetical protein D6732_15730 [Methanobacteriota archaeon]|nr:MAG: hypothetical protein D6732_15730 [Euryarchaeota archaeon]
MRPFAVTTDEHGRIYVFDVAKFATIVYDSSLQYLDEIHYTKGYPSTGHAFFRDSIKIVTIYERRDNDPYRNVHYIHFLDEHFQPTTSLRLDYPPIYEKLNLLNMVFVRWVFQPPYIYVNFPVLPEVYKYDLQGNLVAAFRIETRNFKQISEKVPRKASIVRIREIYNKYSGSAWLYTFRKRYLFYAYYNSVPQKSKMKEKEVVNFSVKPLRKYYYRVLTTAGENIAPEDEHLTGEPLYCTEQGKLYILASDEPDHRVVEVYQIVVEAPDTSQAAVLRE